jgi:DNA-binding CsgD family transcriptional regulator
MAQIFVVRVWPHVLQLHCFVAIGTGRRSVLATAGHPLALLGADGRVIHYNSRFEQLVAEAVLVVGLRLASCQADANRALAAAIASAIGPEASEAVASRTVVLPRAGGRPLIAEVTSVVAYEDRNVPCPVAAIVTLTDLGSRSCVPCADLLQKAFGLTPAEARLASQIGEGRTLANIAHTDDLARQTLRSRLKSIFHKTRTRRQAELTLLMSRIAAYRARVALKRPPVRGGYRLANSTASAALRR